MDINFIPHRRKKKRARAFLFIVLIVGVGLVTYYHKTITAPASADSALHQFIVEPGKGSGDISYQLRDAGLIKNALVFQFYIWQTGISSKLKSGEYFIPGTASIKDIAQILFIGPSATKERTVTFIEGWNNQQIAQYLESQGFGSTEQFLSLVQKKESWWDDFSALASRPRDVDLEGYLFPDTYRIFSDASLEDIIKKMLANFELKLTSQMRADIIARDMTIHQILTLASIIEKEVPGDADRKVVADIFYKRLAAGMALQADSTVNYFTGKGLARASADDISIDHPYNTYKYRGLPPVPITNPSLSAITAAIYPTPNPYWFFLTTPSGEAIYSKTFEEHISNKNKYY